MKFVLTGAAGNITRPLAEILLKAGHDVTVIGRTAENLKPLTDAGATAAIGSVEDVAFLTEIFRGADAVYTMVPPNFATTNWKGFIGSVGVTYAQAIDAAGVKHVVNLSSMGAHMPEGCGPVSGLYRVEATLNALPEDVHVLHLRPSFFYANFFANIPMVKGMGIIGGNYGGATEPMRIVDTDDIAAVAAKALLSLQFTGKSVQYIASDEKTGGEIAAILGYAIGKPELQWVEFSDEQSYGGMKAAGLPEEIAKNYVEMGGAIRSGAMAEDYQKNRPTLSPGRLESFAPKFAGAYHAA